jgi:UDP-N-acetyl-D-galactosamine dehydrogenase
LKDKYKIAVIGLGYVGLPLAKSFSKHFHTIGYDVNHNLIDNLKSKESKSLNFSKKPSDLIDSNIYIIAVPTPVNKDNIPDLRFLESATTLISNYINQNDIVIYESTVYPGVTEEFCIPIIENITSLKLNIDFFCGYSPERISPGDNTKSVEDILKVTSGSNKETADKIDNIYKKIIKAGTYKATSIKVAEASKVIENVQRDVNIALMNEFAMIFDKLNLTTNDVLEAAKTKWNFLDFKPGLVGGHCVGVDPYYLIHKSKKSGFIPNLMNTSRETNNYIPEFISNKLNTIFEKNEKNISKTDVLILGYTFKENCEDIRNSKVLDIETKLTEYGCNVEIYDPLLENNNKIIKDPFKSNKKYDGIILAVSHNDFFKYTEKDFNKISKENLVLLDIKGIYSFATWKF